MSLHQEFEDPGLNADSILGRSFEMKKQTSTWCPTDVVARSPRP
jgi:hypothetical protein